MSRGFTAEDYFGFTAEEVDSATCILTFEGAEFLEACEESLEYWAKKHHKAPMVLDHGFI